MIPVENRINQNTEIKELPGRPVLICRGALLLALESADDCRINGELLTDADEVGVLDVVPLGNLHVVDAEADCNAAQDIAGGHGVDDVVAVVDEAAVGILPAAGHVLEFFFIDVVGHFCYLLLFCFLFTRAV